MSIANDATKVFDAALGLPLEKREELVRELIVSLDRDRPKDPDYDRRWAEEIERRWAEYEHGESELIDEEDAMRRIQAAVDRGRQS